MVVGGGCCRVVCFFDWFLQDRSREGGKGELSPLNFKNNDRLFSNYETCVEIYLIVNHLNVLTFYIL